MLIAFAIACAAISVILGQAKSDGADPYRVINGVDYLGRICGRAESVKDLPLAYWPDPTNFDVMVCAESCNRTQDTYYSLISYQVRLRSSTNGALILFLAD